MCFQTSLFFHPCVFPPLPAFLEWLYLGSDSHYFHLFLSFWTACSPCCVTLPTPITFGFFLTVTSLHISSIHLPHTRKLCLHGGELWRNDLSENPTISPLFLTSSSLTSLCLFSNHLASLCLLSAVPFTEALAQSWIWPLDAARWLPSAPQGRLNADQVSLNHTKESSLSSSTTCKRTVFPHLGYSHFPIPPYLELPCTVFVYGTVHPSATNKQSAVFLLSFMYLLSTGADGHFSKSLVVSRKSLLYILTGCKPPPPTFPVFLYFPTHHL